MEFVYVLKRHDLYTRRMPQGFEPLDESAALELSERIRTRGFFVERRHAELDASLKQIIPYCVVANADELFLMRRRATGGEARLFGKRSIGVGGHVNPLDRDGGEAEPDVVRAGMRREVEEEVHIAADWTSRTVGVLNDDSTDVGSVHFGIVHVIRAEGAVAVRETERLQGGFVRASALRELCLSERDTFESWSAMLVDRIDDVLGAGLRR